MGITLVTSLFRSKIKQLEYLPLFILLFSFATNKFCTLFQANAAVNMNGPPDRVYYYPIGFNLAHLFIGPGVGNFLSIDSQVTNFVSPCQFMHPITIQFIGSYPKSGMTPIKNIICDSVSLEKSLESFQLGADTVKVVKACTDIAQILMESETTYSIFNGANNITIWLKGSELENVVREFNEQLPNKIPQIMNRDVKYQFDPTIFGSDVMDRVGISTYLFKTTTFPFKIGVEYSEIVPGTNSHGTNIPVIEFSVNITLSYELSQQSSNLSSFWTPPTGFGGFFPMLVPNDKFSNGVLYTTYTDPDKNSGFVAWGNINIPITSPFVRIVPPSRIPSSSISCTSNYDFYYPTTDKPVGSVKNYPKRLEALLDKDSSKVFRNTISVQSYWNKIPFGANWYEKGFPVGSPNSQWIETGNYYGGCYYNGTFPLVPSSTNPGFAETICSTQSKNISDEYRTAFYPPPLEFFEYGVSNMQTMITSILQYGVQSSSKSFTFQYNTNVEFLGSYPSFHIFGATPGLQLTSPSPRLNVPYVQYSGRDLIAGDPFFNFNFQYMQDRFGHCSEPNGCWICSNPRIIPWKTEIIDQMNFTEFCASNLTAIPNSRMIALKFYYGNFQEDISAQTASGFQPCLKSAHDRWIPVGRNTTTFTFKANEYNTNTMFIYNTLSNDTCCAPMNTYFYFQHYYTIVTDVYQPIQLTQITPFTDPYAGGILPGIFMNRNFSYQFFIDVYPDDTWTISSQLKLRAWLMCPEIENIDLIAMPETVTLGDIIDSGGRVGGSIKIPPFILSKFYESPTYCVLRAFVFVSEEVEKRNISSLKATKLSDYELLHPRIYRSEEGMHEYSQWIFVNNGFIARSSNIIEPHPGNTSISDALYAPVNVTHHYNFTITPFLFSAVALNTPVFTPESQIFEMVLSGQHNRFGLRLPPTHKKWYVFTRTADKWDQGCYVECRGDMSRSPYAEWCLPEINVENPFSYNLCNYTIVNTSPDISNTQIEDAIAVVTNPISYLSYVDTMSLVNALFSLPTNVELVWGKYFELIYEAAISSHQISFNQDYPFAQPTTLAVISRILNKYYYRERLDINKSLPIQSIQRIYTLVECFLVNGLDNLALNSTDLIGVTNPLPILTPDQLKILLSIYQGVASRKSYTHGVHDTYSIITEKTGNTVFSSTFNQIDMYKGVTVGGISFPKINITSISPDNILFHNGAYYKINKKLYNNKSATEGFISCTKSFNTITVIRTGGYLSNYLVTKDLKNIDEYPLAFSSFVLCTLEYEIWSLENPVELSFFAEYKEEFDYSGVKCTAMKKDQTKLTDELCTTDTTIHLTNQTIEFKCKCNAITYYGLKGKPILYIEKLSDNSLSPLFSKTRPNIFQPFMFISNPKLLSSCSNFLPINIYLKNIPKFIPDESLVLSFKCAIPDNVYSSLDFCAEFAKGLESSDFSFSRIGENINLTYFVNPGLIQKTTLPTNLSFWRPADQNHQPTKESGISGVTVALNVTLDMNRLSIENELPDLFGYVIFDIVTSVKTVNHDEALEVGELSRSFILDGYVNFPGAYTKSNIPISSIFQRNIPYSIPYNSTTECKGFLNSYFMSQSYSSTMLEMSETIGIGKETHFNPELLYPVGNCKVSISDQEFMNGAEFDCIKSTSIKPPDLNMIEQPISMLNITKYSHRNSFSPLKDQLILHNETIKPNINAYFPKIVSNNFPRITIEAGTSKTLEQIVSENGYCDSLIDSCSSCRASRSYQADFQFKDHEFRYYCSATSEEGEIENIRQGLLVACRTDGSYWGHACSFQQSNATISGNTTYTEFDLVTQERLTYIIFAVGIKSKAIDAIECQDYSLSIIKEELPVQIIPLSIPTVISIVSESFMFTLLKFTGMDGWNKSQDFRLISFAYFENTGYFRLTTTPEIYSLTDQAIQTDPIAVSIKFNITGIEVNPRDSKLSVVLVIMKGDSNELINENKLNAIVKRRNVYNLAPNGDYVSYVWGELSFEQDFSLIKMKSAIENMGPQQIIPINFKISNLVGMESWKYSLFAISEDDTMLSDDKYNNLRSNSLLLSFLSSEIPHYIRLPTNYESWLVYLIIHNQNNELLCGIDCTNISVGKIDKKFREMFCTAGSNSKCRSFTFKKTKDILKYELNVNKEEIGNEYSRLLEYFTHSRNSGDINDQLMIASILSTKLEFLSKEQLFNLLQILIEINIEKKDHTGGNSVMILYTLLRILEYSFTSFGKIPVSNNPINVEKILKIALKSECGYNEGFKELITDILDIMIKLNIFVSSNEYINLLGALSVNQWVMSNDFGSNVEMKGKMSKFVVQSSITSKHGLNDGINLGNTLLIPTIDLSNEKIQHINISLIKNIYFELNKNINFDESWGMRLFINCHDPRYGFSIIKSPLENYLLELTQKIQHDTTFNGVFLKVYDAFISRCGYEYRIYDLEGKIDFIVSQEYTPNVVLGKYLSYRCALRGQNGIWSQDSCETKIRQGQILCSCNSIGEYGLLTVYQSSLSEVTVKLSHNPGSIQEVNINDYIYRVNNGKFYYKDQIFEINSNEDIIINQNGVSVGKHQLPVKGYSTYDIVTKLTIRQEGALGTICLRSKEYNFDIEGSNIIYDGFSQGNYYQNSTLIVV